MTTILAEAQALIDGPRKKQYGDPAVGYSRLGRMWAAILGIPDIPPEKAILMMAVLKICREAGNPQWDNLVDACGYLALVERIQKP